ncbi:MAG: hypothetical protein OHK0015_15090 [Chloroflexi bacterium OHK40]
MATCRFTRWRSIRSTRAWLTSPNYAGGLRAIQIQGADPDDTGTCELVEVGGYLDPEGNNFCGVETQIRDGQTYIFASDRDSGLWISAIPRRRTGSVGLTQGGGNHHVIASTRYVLVPATCASPSAGRRARR